jgi:molybdopterin-guanine dinucleotide biosynthesis protein A
MGASKPSLDLQGRPLIDYPAAALVTAGLEAFVVAKEATPLPPLDLPVHFEPDEPSHPALGILEALRRAGGPVVVVACDMPFVAPGLLRRLATSDSALMLPSAGGRLHPLLGRYDVSVTDALEAALAREEPLQQVVAGMDPLLLEEDDLRAYGEPETLLFNVNTPTDLQRAEALVRARA